ncbi:hypothetical protein [Actinacidiphila soli]|uniref:hypothetical protein n=1 Tax=Actinacidiphila soli TaxID=2487275 RepID=UPI002AFFA1BC|nr:hypothetical protein [Actinacidiphila soli]
MDAAAHVHPAVEITDANSTVTVLAATARGVRGLCEVRDAGPPVPLTDEGPTIYRVDLDEASDKNQLARGPGWRATGRRPQVHRG